MSDDHEAFGEDFWISTELVFSRESIVGAYLGHEENEFLVTTLTAASLVAIKDDRAHASAESSAVRKTWPFLGADRPTQPAITYSPDQFYVVCGSTVLGWKWPDKSTASMRKDLGHPVRQVLLLYFFFFFFFER